MNTVNDKLIKYALISLSITIVFFCFIIFIDNNLTRHVSATYKLDTISHWRIEEIKEGNIYIKIKGWAYEPHQPKGQFKTSILLKNSKINSYIKINTDMRDAWFYIIPENGDRRTDIGFVATVNKNLLKKDNDYEICILTFKNGMGRIVFTNKIINI